MTTPSALQLLSEVARVHGRIVPRPPDHIEVFIPEAEQPRLFPLLRQRKTDLLMLLAKPEGRCPAGHSPGYWQDAVGQWHCMDCEPKPEWRYLRGVTLDVLGNRPITLERPTGDLPAPKEWVRVPGGATAEVVLYEATGAEVLVRMLRSEQLRWFAAGELLSEMDWGGTA